MTDSAARQSIRNDLQVDLVVEAAAGTGKTTELLARIVAVLAAGLAPVEGIVAVTFTEKAAGELKLRLRAALDEARRTALEGTARSNLDRALSRLEEARVSTIHGFCAELLRERPVAAGVDPRFTVLTEVLAERLFSQTFGLFLQQALEDPPEGIRRSLRRHVRDGGDGPSERLRRAAWNLCEFRDFPAPFRRDPFDRAGDLGPLVDALHAFAALTEDPHDRDDTLAVDTVAARRLSEEIRRVEGVRERDLDGLEAQLVRLASDRAFNGGKRKGKTKGLYRPGVSNADVQAARARLVDGLSRFAAAADADLSAALQGELLPSIERYEAAKRRAGLLDFLDLLLKTRDLLRDVADVREELRGRFARIFVDEFQDTDPLQAEILTLLAGDGPPGRLFLVGDPKQAIYRFRRADVGTYREVTDRLVARGASKLFLTMSFRAVPGVQEAVNASFAPAMTGDEAALEASYVPLEPSRPFHDGQPAVVALPVPAPYGFRGGITARSIEESLPQAVGAFVAWLLQESGWTVTERADPGRRVSVEARHVCLLFRRFESWGRDVTRDYVRALEGRGVPHLLVGGKSYHVREEVESMRAALSALEWPDDELSVFATLHGPLFAIGDEELAAYRYEYGRLHPFVLPKGDVPEALRVVVGALGLLAGLSRGRNHRPVAETIARLLDETRAHASFVLRPAGEQALANVLHVAELARQHELSGGLSFRSFVDRLREDAEGASAPDAPILEEGSDGVRLMTVHKAKGLEFPVVVLVDPTAKLSGRVSRHLDPVRGLCAQRLGGLAPVDLLESEPVESARERAEGVRVAYVAATRARDLLVVPAVGDEPYESGWLSPLNRALYPERGAWRRSFAGPGCPTFGDESVVERPVEVAFTAESVRPGLHQNGVVWWDPNVLALGAPPTVGLRQEELLGTERDDAVAQEDAAAYEAWREARAEVLASASVPSRVVWTATEKAAKERDPNVTVELVELPIDEARPPGRRFGTLVHAIFASVPLESPPDDVLAVARREGRCVAATEDEVTFAAAAVSSALTHDLFARARAAERRGECRRETPVTLLEPGGRLVEGVVDLAFFFEGIWTVIDFKTDRELEKALPVYRQQVSIYADAIATATGSPATAILLRV